MSILGGRWRPWNCIHKLWHHFAMTSESPTLYQWLMLATVLSCPFFVIPGRGDALMAEEALEIAEVLDNLTKA
jgi:hypothetical protein